ncbi:TetR family transcriptional regulator C-terminal domain-containing protein [Kaistia geumhonensis]|uniref:TetR/AcrR family transcriptional regulator n=1 Tax=Kaistia geumhonensis TaxID=410839 RepID=A0ABU0M626_9HYPH|nr:TetR family transcriptional regulator C-terminal domain-containing protein [Kaistia geumhonensis]MCX5478371.1 TetR family transcriptional regulator C-terminal domain-containing protein [Kaistia geumhonensis]MDQ0516411.1 TetR/AcrR family transcriptional regulator [Kaistia geumhonensis]
MTIAETARARQTKKRTRIQEENEERILDAALEVFSSYGLRGATIDQIAALAGMTKPNLLYYFRRKDDIYLSVLRRTLENWLQPLEDLGRGDDPRDEMRAYLERKLEMSRDNPKASRLYAMEMLQGAPVLRGVLGTRLKDLVDEKAALMRRWIAEGRMAPIDPYHLIFMVWATTQHYADFEIQVRAVLGDKAADNRHFKAATHALEDVILGGIFGR